MQSHIYFDTEKMRLRLLDQSRLPREESWVECASYQDVIKAIKTMVVRGAPAIGVAAAWACVLAVKEARKSASSEEFVKKSFAEIAAARPTAVNLAWAVQRMQSKSFTYDCLDAWVEEAAAIQAEDLEICEKIGQVGRNVLKDGDTVLTHCNAGSLATAGYGTALGVIRAAIAQGKRIQVIADETRPLLQGSRLTAFELANDGIAVTIAPDNAAAHLLSHGYAQTIITGADRIAANGDTANKIGTLGLAILASYYHIPFYIAAPLSTIDPAIIKGQDIPVETRSPMEVLTINGLPIAPANANALNFAFDVTPAHLISGIITEKGILTAPFAESIKKAFTA